MIEVEIKTEKLQKISVALRTVEFHKQNLHIKLDANNPIELYKAAVRLNLLSPK